MLEIVGLGLSTVGGITAAVGFFPFRHKDIMHSAGFMGPMSSIFEEENKQNPLYQAALCRRRVTAIGIFLMAIGSGLQLIALLEHY